MAAAMDGVSNPPQLVPLLSQTFQDWINLNREIWDAVPSNVPNEGRLYGFKEDINRVLKPICRAVGEGLRNNRRCLPRLFKTNIIRLGQDQYEAQLATVEDEDQLGQGEGFTIVEVKSYAKFLYMLVHALLYANPTPENMEIQDVEAGVFLSNFNRLYRLIADDANITLESAKYYTQFLSVNPLFFGVGDMIFFKLKCYNFLMMDDEDDDYRIHIRLRCGNFVDCLRPLLDETVPTLWCEMAIHYRLSFFNYINPNGVLEQQSYVQFVIEDIPHLMM